MARIVIFGNSGSGKSTLASQLAQANSLTHLDLDTIAWQPCTPPERLPIHESQDYLDAFTAKNQHWVIEGCYSDLLLLVLPLASEIIYLNLPVEACVQNARSRPWEPHKYESRQAQDANLEMLIDWIEQYESRTDTFSKAAHDALFEQYTGKKSMFCSNEQRPQSCHVYAPGDDAR